MIILFVCLIAILGIAMYTALNVASAHASSMDQLNREYNAAEQRKITADEAMTMTSDDAGAVLASARELGDEVASLQTTYPSVVFTHPYQDDLIVEYGERGKACFASSESAARSIWLSQMTVPYTWTFKSGYEFDVRQAEEGLPCVWICTENDAPDAPILAYAFGTYLPEQKVFTNWSVKTTAYGTSKLMTSDDPSTGMSAVEGNIPDDGNSGVPDTFSSTSSNTPEPTDETYDMSQLDPNSSDFDLESGDDARDKFDSARVN